MLHKKLFNYKNVLRTNFDTGLSIGRYCYNDEDFGKCFPKTQSVVNTLIDTFPDLDNRAVLDQIDFPEKAQAWYHPSIYPWQQDNIDFMIQNRRCIVGDEVGLGKTMQSLLAVHELLKNQNDANILVITRKSLTDQWDDEVRQWIGNLHCAVNISKMNKVDAVYCLDNISRGKNVFITHHEILLTHKNKLPYLPFDAVIVDEAHRFKNKKAKKYEVLKRLLSQKVNKDIPLFLLTGTPQEKSPADMWALLHLIDPKKYSSYWAFYNCFVKIEKQGDYDKIIGGKNINHLHSFIAEDYTKNIRSECLTDLKEVQIIKRSVVPTKQESQVHDLISKESYIPKYDLEIPNPMSRMHYQRLSCVGYSPLQTLLPAPSKLEALKQIIEDNPTEKILCFTSFRQTCLDYSSALTCDHYFGGSDPQVVEEFKSDPQAKCLIATPESLGEGHNITEASIIVFLNPPLSGTVNRQAIGRIDRIGQTKPPIVYYLCAKGTVEEYIINMIQRKNFEFDKSTIVKDYYV